ncbi:hypothetical protein D3Q16_26760 [Salmonella enterica]|nr:hypothetical protein [Salmonella enterica]
MGLFGGVSQQEHDKLKDDYAIMRFNYSLEEMKATGAFILANMSLEAGKAWGYIESIKALYDLQMLDAARTLYISVKPRIIEAIQESNTENQGLIEIVDGLGDCKQAFLNYCSNEGKAKSLTERVNDINALNGSGWKLLQSMDQMFGIVRG